LAAVGALIEIHVFAGDLLGGAAQAMPRIV